MEYGLIGEKLGHSHSPKIHAIFGSYDYKLVPLKKQELQDFILRKEFMGLNVTIPYKQAVIPYLDRLDDIALKLGAVNTIVNENGSLIGYNTDYFGFDYLLKEKGFSVEGLVCAVLGSGGASKTVCAVLQDNGAKEVVVVSRSGEHDYEYIKSRKDVNVIVNATPVGTFPDAFSSPIDLSVFPKLNYVVDLVYNPFNTALISQAQALGIKNANGIYMLVAQAARASELFTGNIIHKQQLSDAAKNFGLSVQNVVLVGMPGSGKTTIGKLYAQKTGREFIDTDEVFCSVYGKTAGTYILENGEQAFRIAESEIVKKVCLQSGKVIATGGGAILKEENRACMKKNSRVVWLERELKSLAIEGRPLSKSAEEINRLYEIRKPLYQSLSDYQIQVTDNPDKALSDMLRILS